MVKCKSELSIDVLMQWIESTAFCFSLNSDFSKHNVQLIVGYACGLFFGSFLLWMMRMFFNCIHELTKVRLPTKRNEQNINWIMIKYLTHIKIEA